MANLVLGAAVGFSDIVIERFAGSLREVSPEADLAIFLNADDLTDKVQALGEKFRIAFFVMGEAPVNVHSFRFFVFHKFLREDATAYRGGRVFIADVRDVLFQRDVFSYPLEPNADLYFFSEKKKIGECHHNSRWLRLVSTDEIANEFAGENIICSGTTLGSYDAILAYLEAMTSISSDLSKRLTEYFIGVDQGVHNYIYYKRKLPGFTIALLDNEHGPVNTLKYAKKIVNEDGFVCDENGKVSYVAHQIDRIPLALLKKMRDTRPHPLSDIIIDSIKAAMEDEGLIKT